MSAIHEVAKRAGVAPITVSRVVNNNGYVSEETRRRVEAAIEEMNYIPNALGPSLRSKRTQTLALVLSDITNPFWTTVARGVEDAANARGHHIIIGNTEFTASSRSCVKSRTSSCGAWPYNLRSFFSRSAIASAAASAP